MPRIRDLLEHLDQPRDVPVERLLAAEPLGVGRHEPPGPVVGHPVEGVGQRPAGVGGGDDEAFPALGDQLPRAVAGGAEPVLPHTTGFSATLTHD